MSRARTWWAQYGRRVGARRCGHVPGAPKLHPEWRTWVGLHPLREAIANLHDRGYDHRRKELPRLRRRRRRPAAFKTWGKGMTGPVLNAEVSRRRSDRAEAVVRLLTFAISRCDVADLQVLDLSAAAKRKKWAQFTLEEITRATGLSPWRVDRALSDCVAAGYCYRHQPKRFDQDRQQWLGDAALWKLTLRLFEDLGITKAALDVCERRKATQAARMERRLQRRRARREQLAAAAGLAASAPVPVAPNVAELVRPARPRPANDQSAAALSQRMFQLVHDRPELAALPEEELRRLVLAEHPPPLPDE